MTEELIRLAKNGKTDAMLELGKYYFKKNEFTESAKWFEQAAKYGDSEESVHATIQAAQVKSFVASVELERWGPEEALPTWNDAYIWAAKALDCVGKLPAGTRTTKKYEMLAILEKASYYLALCYYKEKQYDNAVALVRKHIEEPRFGILFALIQMDISTNWGEVEQAMNLAASCIKNPQYIGAIKDSWEEDMYAEAAFTTSYLYRDLGKRRGAHMEEFAVALLNCALNGVKQELQQSVLRNELNHYQKKLLGGYKYVE